MGPKISASNIFAVFGKPFMRMLVAKKPLALQNN
jgi:hypothetical protein